MQIHSQIRIDPNLQPVGVLLSLFPVWIARQMGIPISWSLPWSEGIWVGANAWNIDGVLSSIRLLGGISGVGGLVAGSRGRAWIASLRIAGFGIRAIKQFQYRVEKKGQERLTRMDSDQKVTLCRSLVFYVQ